MDCRELEDRLEALLDGELDERQRQRCDRHLQGCPSCRELVEPFGVAEPPPADLVEAVLAGTSGSPCGQAESLLCDWLDGVIGGPERELMGAHLDSCGECRALSAALARLQTELPHLAELRPDPGFVEAVLAATLPVRVRLRRWWAAVWPRWVRRPRFASEAAFVATMVLVLIFATPGSPLAAVPNQAMTLARTDPGASLEARLEAPVAALEEGFTARVKEPISAQYGRAETVVLGWAGAAEEHGRAAAGVAARWFGTSREWLASLFGSADEKDSETHVDASNTTQETP